MLGGRVKTLHPRRPRGNPRPSRASRRISRRSRSTTSSRSTSCASTSTRSSSPSTVPSSTRAGLIEMIDIGGPALAARGGEELRLGRSRSARSQDYDRCSNELRAGDGTLTMRAASTPCGNRVRAYGRIRRRDRAVVPARRDRSRRRSFRHSNGLSTSRTARTRTSAPRTTRSVAPGHICSPSSTSFRASRSRSTI